MKRINWTLSALPALVVGNAIVVLWFLWPLHDLSLASVSYALVAGCALFLVAWASATVASPLLASRSWARVLLVGSVAFTIGLGAGVGYAIAMGPTSAASLASQVPSSALDALVCAAAAAVVLWLSRRAASAA
jgi:hypothetical protein